MHFIKKLRQFYRQKIRKPGLAFLISGSIFATGLFGGTNKALAQPPLIPPTKINCQIDETNTKISPLFYACAHPDSAPSNNLPTTKIKKATLPLFQDLHHLSQKIDLHSMTTTNGYINTNHIQPFPHDLNQRHHLTLLKVKTNHGHWMFYNLSPNSVRKETFAFGYMSAPVKLGFDKKTEISTAFLLATGYTARLTPGMFINVRHGFTSVNVAGGALNIGVETSLLPFIANERDKNGFRTNKISPGVVVATPQLSLRYTFNKNPQKKNIPKYRPPRF